MIADRLRSSILQAAISGKLTDQRPEDGTAAELLEQIAAERAALIKEKKLKKPKPLPPVTGEGRRFVIPPSWVWTRVGEVARYAQRGKSPTYADVSPYSAVSQKCVRWSGFDSTLARPYAPKAFEALPQERILSAGDILWNSTGTGTVGRSTVLPDSGDYSAMAADSHVTVIRTFRKVLPRFVDVFISAPHIQQNMDDLTSGTTKQQELNLSTILELPLPLPPLAEQERIIAKLEEVLPLIDQLAELEREREHLDREFAKAIERAILQAAISGKLTEQLPEDGTATELLETIKAERQQLEKEGKIRKQKQLPAVTIDEQVFGLPGSWAWINLGETISLLSGRDLTPEQYTESPAGIPYITGASNFENGSLIINRWTERPVTIAREDDLLITCKGTIGDLAVLKEPEAHIARQVMAITCFQVRRDYVAAFLAYSVTALKAQAKSMIPGISRDMLLRAPLPLPPLFEQERIVAKLDQAMPLVRDIGDLVS